MMRYSDHVDSKTIRNVLKEILPEEQMVDAALIANVRESQVNVKRYGERRVWKVKTIHHQN